MLPQVNVFKDGIRIGETFPKRAKQLVNRQKANWLDEIYSAINLISEKSEEEINLDSKIFETQSNEGYRIVKDNLNDHYDDEKMMYLAKKRVSEKSNMKWHAILYIVGIPFIFMLFPEELDHYLHMKFLMYTSELGVLTAFFIWSSIFFVHIKIFYTDFQKFKFLL